MLSKRLLSLLAGVVLLAGLAGACATTVNHVLADPSRYRDREVKLSGQVMDSYSVADRGVYRIADRTGELWVLSARGVPRTGARVTVRGTIRDTLNLGNLGRRITLPPSVRSGLILIERSHEADF
jgi:hypothetical protein